MHFGISSPAEQPRPQCYSLSKYTWQNSYGTPKHPLFQTVIVPNERTHQELQVAAKFFIESVWKN